jgi:hypothetical protein
MVLLSRAVVVMEHRVVPSIRVRWLVSTSEIDAKDLEEYLTCVYTLSNAGYEDGDVSNIVAMDMIQAPVKMAKHGKSKDQKYRLSTQGYKNVALVGHCAERFAGDIVFLND